MKNKIVFIIIFLMFLFIIDCTPALAVEIHFEDTYLYNNLKYELKGLRSFQDKCNNTIELSEEDKNSVKTLYLSYGEEASFLYKDAGPISSLSGVENFVNLERIFMWNNQLSDLSPLNNLSNLKLLDITGNNVSDLSPISNITTLETLIVDNNSIKDISAISSLINLKYLSFSGNNISTITPISSIPNLLSLRFDRNNISDISPVSTKNTLNLLSANENNIENLSHLANLSNLTILYLRKNKISNISNLSNLTNLNELNLDNNLIEDLTPIKNNLIYTYFPAHTSPYSFSAMNQVLSKNVHISTTMVELPDVLKNHNLKIDKTNSSMEVKIQDNKVEFYNANPGDKVVLTNEDGYNMTKQSVITYTFYGEKDNQNTPSNQNIENTVGGNNTFTDSSNISSKEKDDTPNTGFNNFFEILFCFIFNFLQLHVTFTFSLFYTSYFNLPLQTTFLLHYLLYYIRQKKSYI